MVESRLLPMEREKVDWSSKNMEESKEEKKPVEDVKKEAQLEKKPADDVKKEVQSEKKPADDVKEEVQSEKKTVDDVKKEAQSTEPVKVQDSKEASVEDKKKGRGKDSRKSQYKGNSSQGRDENSEYIEKVISINRITKVTKGGKKLSFSALVVVGDTKGKVGYSLCKAAEVAVAIRKAMAVAKKNMVSVPMKGTTITHEIIGQCGGARVLLKPASDGTGVIASGPVRAVCDGAGIHNILTKCHRSNNPINVVKAAIDGLSRLKF